MDSEKIIRKLGIFDYAVIETEAGTVELVPTEEGGEVSDVRIQMKDDDGHENIFFTAEESLVKFIKLRWHRHLPSRVKILGDAWERGYGDMQWRGISGSRVMPWYFLMSGENHQWAFGVRTQPSAMCFWQADPQGLTLVLDVRCGGRGVALHGRTLKAAEIICMETEGNNSFRAAREFCKMMCPNPVFPHKPVYGSNNWYYAYGDSSQEEILKDADYLRMLTEDTKNAPYMVIDDGWQECHRLNEYNGGPWRGGNVKFPDMKGLAEKLVQKGLRPGIWVRLLQNEDARIHQEWRLPANGCLDPSHPDALEYIKEDIRRICEWGYTLIKHDFSTYDLFGRWGFEMGALVAPDGWCFYDRSKTSAEIVKDFYQAIFDTANMYGAEILGCNTIGHLGAGLMQVSRVGDDTSGLNWERTRYMGINSLAFRLPQHRTFFDIDADCVGIAGNIAWEMNRQWASLIAETGTPLFLSVKPGILSQEQILELRKIMIKASEQQSHKIPCDWEYTDCPDTWCDQQEKITYDWYGKTGVSLTAGKNEKYYVYLPKS